MAVVICPSQGRLALIRVLQTLTQREVAARVKRTSAAVSKWSTGARKPRRVARIALEREVGIPLKSWEKLPPLHRA